MTTANTRRAPKNRTNVRFFFIRLALRLLSLVAPAAAESWALRLWSTPRRPRPPRPPEVPGTPGRRFTVRGPLGDLAAWSWGGGPTVLLAHGWSGYAGQMAAFVAPLAAAGFRVVAFDQPAHGQSEGNRANGLWMQEAVAAVARQVGPVHAIVAHSLGATSAVVAMSEGGLLVQRVVLLSPPADAPPFARAFAAALGLPAARAEGMVDRARRSLGGDFSRLDLRRIAPRMRAQLLVVHDPEDSEVPFAHGQAIAEAWPGGRLRATSGLGHRGALRRPEVVAEVVEFVSGPAVATSGWTRPDADQPRVAVARKGSDR
jgi:pimeloyl-ACP methyl ester carboxylesterase